MLIDFQQLSQLALRGIAEQFVLSQLSDTESAPDMDLWVQQAIEMVKRGELVVEFSQVDESVTLKRVEDIVEIDEPVSFD